MSSIFCTFCAYNVLNFFKTLYVLVMCLIHIKAFMCLLCAYLDFTLGYRMHNHLILFLK